MKATNYTLLRYDAEEGKVFDYKEPRYNEDGEQIHCYAVTLFMGDGDSIDNYIEVDVPTEEE